MRGQATVKELIESAVDAGVVPGAVVAAGRWTAEPVLLHVAGDAQCHDGQGDDGQGHDGQGDDAARRPMTEGTVFDLASLTKIVATTPIVLHLVGAGEVGLDDPARRYLAAFSGPRGSGSGGRDEVTVRQLLTHTSGLPDTRNYHEHGRDAAEVRAAALAEPLVTAPGTICCYSDIGFIALGELAAAVAGCSLAELAQRVVCAPLGMARTRYLPPGEWAGQVAATEAAGGTAKVGMVHDENAAALGGVAGHAGLFGTAGDLARYAAAWVGKDSPLAAAGLLPPGLRAAALRCQTEGLGGRRGLGWGLRGDQWDGMGDGWPATGAGHTGFTGTSLSIDARSGLWAVLLTNAVHYGRGPAHSVVGLRKQVHAAVVSALLG
jgi:CubicO group peptidase (beta-lactamase class C family)